MASTASTCAGRDLAAQRKAQGMSQRAMPARLDVSQQTVLALETRFVGRSRTLASYLRILGLHHMLAQPGRRLVPHGNETEADLIYTPRALALAIIEELRPHLSGELLDPARGEGAFHAAFPRDLIRHCAKSATATTSWPGTGAWTGSSPTRPSANSAHSCCMR